MWKIFKYLGIVIFALCSSYYLVCGVVLFFFYQDRSGGVSYVIQAILPMSLYVLFFFSDELYAWVKKRKINKGIPPTLHV